MAVSGVATKAIFTARSRQDFKWLTEHYQELVRQYPDRWIAVYGKEVVAVADNGADAERLAKERKGGDCQPVIAFIEGRAYVY
jgi:hypothetical protein